MTIIRLWRYSPSEDRYINIRSYIFTASDNKTVYGKDIPPKELSSPKLFNAPPQVPKRRPKKQLIKYQTRAPPKLNFSVLKSAKDQTQPRPIYTPPFSRQSSINTLPYSNQEYGYDDNDDSYYYDDYDHPFEKANPFDKYNEILNIPRLPSIPDVPMKSPTASIPDVPMKSTSNIASSKRSEKDSLLRRFNELRNIKPVDIPMKSPIVTPDVSMKSSNKSVSKHTKYLKNRLATLETHSNSDTKSERDAILERLNQLRNNKEKPPLTPPLSPTLNNSIVTTPTPSVSLVGSISDAVSQLEEIISHTFSTSTRATTPELENNNNIPIPLPTDKSIQDLTTTCDSLTNIHNNILPELTHISTIANSSVLDDTINNLQKNIHKLSAFALIENVNTLSATTNELSHTLTNNEPPANVAAVINNTSNDLIAIADNIQLYRFQLSKYEVEQKLKKLNDINSIISNSSKSASVTPIAQLIDTFFINNFKPFITALSSLLHNTPQPPYNIALESKNILTHTNNILKSARQVNNSYNTFTNVDPNDLDILQLDNISKQNETYFDKFIMSAEQQMTRESNLITNIENMYKFLSQQNTNAFFLQHLQKLIWTSINKTSEIIFETLTANQKAEYLNDVQALLVEQHQLENDFKQQQTVTSSTVTQLLRYPSFTARGTINDLLTCTNDLIAQDKYLSAIYKSKVVNYATYIDNLYACLHQLASYSPIPLPNFQPILTAHRELINKLSSDSDTIYNKSAFETAHQLFTQRMYSLQNAVSEELNIVNETSARIASVIQDPKYPKHTSYLNDLLKYIQSLSGAHIFTSHLKQVTIQDAKNHLESRLTILLNDPIFTQNTHPFSTLLFLTVSSFVRSLSELFSSESRLPLSLPQPILNASINNIHNDMIKESELAFRFNESAIRTLNPIHLRNHLLRLLNILLANFVQTNPSIRLTRKRHTTPTFKEDLKKQIQEIPEPLYQLPPISPKENISTHPQLEPPLPEIHIPGSPSLTERLEQLRNQALPPAGDIEAENQDDQTGIPGRYNLVYLSDDNNSDV